MANYILAVLSLCRPAGIAAFFCIFFLSAPALADTVEAKLPAGVTAKANFHAGLASLPAVLVLHGFLQTNQSPPMNSLAGNLASRGYTVLNPTMSLNINRRSQSMACEAAHTHTMEGEVAEVGYWVNWLYKKGYKEIVLTGFSSSGNHAILAYNAQGPHPAVKLAILTNLNPNDSDDRERQQTSPAANGKNLSRYRLGFCKNNFTATANSYLSYAQYDENRLLALLKNTSIRTEVVIGSADPVLPPNWADRIRALHSPTQVRMIKNANHFFDGIQEFDLAEEVENILKNITVR